MCPKATLATEVSSTSRIVASITATATSHGLTLGRHGAVSSGMAAGCDMGRWMKQLSCKHETADRARETIVRRPTLPRREPSRSA